jgi:hypothetical protein
MRSHLSAGKVGRLDTQIFVYGFAVYVIGVIVTLPINGGVKDPLVCALLFVLTSLAWVFRWLSLRMQSAAPAHISARI